MSIRERANRQTPDIIVTLGAAGTSAARREITRQGRKFMCMSASVDGVVKIGLDQEPVEFLYTQVGQQLSPEDGVFDKIYLENTEYAGTVEIHLKTTMGDIVDNRLVLVGGSINSTIVNFPGSDIDDAEDIAIASGDTETVAANDDRRALILQNLSANMTLRVGKSPSATRGYRLAPETSVVIETSGEVSVYNAGSLSASFSVTEVLT